MPSESDPIEQFLDEIESQVPEPEESAEDLADEFVWRDEAPQPDRGGLDQETIDAMWRSTSVYTDQYMTRVADQRPSDYEQRRWAHLERFFRQQPRFWCVADCEDCDWVVGGWLNETNATKALREHMRKAHQKKPKT